LMQMGRWFGFRPGYRDLVRLYIGRHEPLTPAQRRFIDLYGAFEAICVDEESFRSQICEYAAPKDGSKPLTPRQVPPLVTSTHPQLKPAAKNRMFNAVLKSRNFGGQWIERTLVSDTAKDLEHNAALLAQLVDSAESFQDRRVQMKGSTVSAPGYLGIVTHSAVVECLTDYRWAKPDATTLIRLELEFFRGKSSIGDPEIEDWILYMPQVKSKRDPWVVAERTFATVERSRVDSFGRFKAFSEPRHRQVAEILVGVADGEVVGDDAGLLAAGARRGSLLVYPTYPFKDAESDWPEIPAMGIAILPPNNSHPRRLAWGVKDAKNPKAVTIPLA
jgi:Z1 domain